MKARKNSREPVVLDGEKLTIEINEDFHFRITQKGEKLIVTKVYFNNDDTITIPPCVSNGIIIG